jgi:hypothetical protein
MSGDPGPQHWIRQAATQRGEPKRAVRWKHRFWIDDRKAGLGRLGLTGGARWQPLAAPVRHQTGGYAATGPMEQSRPILVRPPGPASSSSVRQTAIWRRHPETAACAALDSPFGRVDHDGVTLAADRSRTKPSQARSVSSDSMTLPAMVSGMNRPLYR